MSEDEQLNLLKQKDPARYKAITIASLGYFRSETNVASFIEDLTSYISRGVTGEVPAIEFPIPEESKVIEKLSNDLIKDIHSESVPPQEITDRMKSLTYQTLESLKNVIITWEESTADDGTLDLRSMEKAVGFYDQLMLIGNISKLADKKQSN
jgi:hypothetical protein